MEGAGRRLGHWFDAREGRRNGTPNPKICCPHASASSEGVFRTSPPGTCMHDLRCAAGHTRGLLPPGLSATCMQSSVAKYPLLLICTLRCYTIGEWIPSSDWPWLVSMGNHRFWGQRRTWLARAVAVVAPLGWGYLHLFSPIACSSGVRLGGRPHLGVGSRQNKENKKASTASVQRFVGSRLHEPAVVVQSGSPQAPQLAEPFT